MASRSLTRILFARRKQTRTDAYLRRVQTQPRITDWSDRLERNVPPYNNFDHQHQKVESLRRLEQTCLKNPARDLGPALHALRQELVELERLSNVSLNNPSVGKLSQIAFNHFKFFKRDWTKHPEEAAMHAKQAVRCQIQGVIEGYRTIAGFRIIEVTEIFESEIGSRLEEQLWAPQHYAAQSAFEKALYLIANYEFDKARELFTEAILRTERLRHSLRRR